jgi:hypothetical protein
MPVLEINWNPNRRQLRQFASIWLVGFVLVGLLVAWRAGALASGVPIGWHRPWTAPLIIWAVALAGSLVSLAVPAAALWVYRVWMGVAFPIGWAVSHLLLVVMYYVVFTGVGLVFRLIGRDPLHRRFDRSAASYWIRRPPTPDVDRYFKRF